MNLFKLTLRALLLAICLLSNIKTKFIINNKFMEVLAIDTKTKTKFKATINPKVDGYWLPMMDPETTDVVKTDDEITDGVQRDGEDDIIPAYQFALYKPLTFSFYNAFWKNDIKNIIDEPYKILAWTPSKRWKKQVEVVDTEFCLMYWFRTTSSFAFYSDGTTRIEEQVFEEKLPTSTPILKTPMPENEYKELIAKNEEEQKIIRSNLLGSFDKMIETRKNNITALKNLDKEIDDLNKNSKLTENKDELEQKNDEKIKLNKENLLISNKLNALEGVIVYKIEINEASFHSDFEEELYFFYNGVNLKYSTFLVDKTYLINNDYINGALKKQKNKDDKFKFVFNLFKKIQFFTNVGFSETSLNIEMSKYTQKNENFTQLIEFLLLKTMLEFDNIKTSIFTNENNKRLTKKDDVIKRYQVVSNNSLERLATSLINLSPTKRAVFINQRFSEEEFETADKLVKNLSPPTKELYDIKKALPELIYFMISETQKIAPKQYTGEVKEQFNKRLSEYKLKTPDYKEFVEGLRSDYLEKYMIAQFNYYTCAKYNDSNLDDDVQFAYMMKRLVVHGIINPDMEADKEFLYQHRHEFVVDQPEKKILI